MASAQITFSVPGSDEQAEEEVNRMWVTLSEVGFPPISCALIDDNGDEVRAWAFEEE